MADKDISVPLTMKDNSRLAPKQAIYDVTFLSHVCDSSQFFHTTNMRVFFIISFMIGELQMRCNHMTFLFSEASFHTTVLKNCDIVTSGLLGFFILWLG